MSRLPDDLRANLPDDLAEAQLAGIDIADVDENVRLWGPPGTGKSTQSALRTATRAHEEGLHPSQMTVVTYRKALAGAVKQRIESWGVFGDPDREAFKYWTTIHAACSRATNFHERFADPDQRGDLEGMVGRKAQYRFCKKLGINHSPSRPWFETKWTVFEDLYSYAKNNLLDLGSYPNVPDERLRPLNEDIVADSKLSAFDEQWGDTDPEHVARLWEDFKRHHDCYDFYEQLTAALSGPLPAMDHVVIDEFHDATPLMAAVSDRWIKNAETAIVAGDPDQVVNAYAGASPEFFEQVGDRTGVDIPVVQLSKSYRCRDEHFQAASRLLSKHRQPPAVETMGHGAMNRWVGQEFKETENGWITPPAAKDGSPTHLWNEYGDDIMYLARTKRQCNAISAALDKSGIIYCSQDSVGGDWEKRLQLMNALEMLTKVTPPTASTPANTAGLTDRDETNIHNYAFSQEQARVLRKHSSGHYLKDEDGWNWYLRQLEDGQEVPLQEWNEYVKPKWWLRYTNGRPSIRELVYIDDSDEIAMQKAWERYDTLPAAPVAVDTRVLTIHASKGAEASQVVLYDGVTGSVLESMGESENLEENEYRTWYVALTRASERLHFVRGAFESANDFLPSDLEPLASQQAQSIRGVAHE